MAKLPAVVPKWASTAYGGDPIAWDEARRQCQTALYSWATEGHPRFYSDLVPLVTAIEWPQGAYTNDGQQMGFLLGQVSLEQLNRDEDRPLMSALVIAKTGEDANLPSGGFWTLCDELGITVGKTWPERQAFWVREFERCVRVYGNAAPGGKR